MSGVWVYLVEATLTHLSGNVERQYYGPFSNPYLAESFENSELEYDERSIEILCVRERDVGHYNASRTL